MKTLSRSILGALLAVTVMGCTSTDATSSGRISCSNRVDDWWRVSVSGPSTVTIEVDTVSSSTAFDPAFEIYDVAVWSDDVNGIVVDQFIDDADDEFVCSFPPPEFECPSGTYEASRDFLLAVENLGSCRGGVGDYDLRIFGANGAVFLGSEPN